MIFQVDQEFSWIIINSGKKTIMHTDEHRNQYSILISSGFSSIISTLITNPIEVAKTNMQYYPLSCQHYPHQSLSLFIQVLNNSLHAAVLPSQFKAQSGVLKWYYLKSHYPIFSTCKFMKIVFNISKIN